jgi:uncharacterized protein (TIGR04222 family)
MNLNPFDLPGPEFLSFYMGLILVVGVLLYLVQWRAERGPGALVADSARDLAVDPYQMAFLRAGRREVLRTAVVSLLERGLLKAHDSRLAASRADAAALARRPLDKAILHRFADATSASALFTDTTIQGEAAYIGEVLELQGLLPDVGMRRARMLRVLLALGLFGVVAVIKLGVALSRGRHNVLLLCLLAAAAGWQTIRLGRRPRTILGDSVCRYLPQLFGGLRKRPVAWPSRAPSDDLTFKAALYGLAALPEAMAKLIQPLNLVKSPQGASAWGSCGSSCAAASSVSASGGGCGGGGCGGGCGGCGG